MVEGSLASARVRRVGDHFARGTDVKEVDDEVVWQDQEREAQRNKTGATEAFREGEYAQAIVVSCPFFLVLPTSAPAFTFIFTHVRPLGEHAKNFGGGVERVHPPSLFLFLSLSPHYLQFLFLSRPSPLLSHSCTY